MGLHKKKVYKKHLKSIARNGIKTNIKFWTTIKTFLTHKGMITSHVIVLKQWKDITRMKQKVTEIPNKAYINVVENTTRKKSVSVVDIDVNFSTPVDTVLEKYKSHPSVWNIRKHSRQANYFSFAEATTGDVLLKRLNINKAMGEDPIPLKLVKITGEFLVESLTDIINSCFNRSTFPDLAKWGLVIPVDKDGADNHVSKKYRAVSELNTFFKIMDSSIHSFIHSFISIYLPF